MRSDGKKNKREVTSAKINKTSVVGRPANGDTTDPLLKSQAANGGETIQTEDYMSNIDPAAVAKEAAEGLVKELGDSVDGKLDVIAATMQTSMEKMLEPLTVELEMQKAMGSITDEEKAYMAKMPDAERASFMKMDADERKKRMDSMRKSDESVTIDGQTMYKSQTDGAVFALLKAQAEKTEALEKAQREAMEKAEHAEYMAKASSEYPNLPGKRELVASMLKAVDSVADEGAKEGLRSLLKAQNDRVGESLNEIGTSEASSGAHDAEQRLEKMVKEHAEKTGASNSESIRAVYGSKEGAELIKQMREK